VVVGATASKPSELRVGKRARVCWAGITALGIRLPDLDHGIRDRLAVAVENPSLHADLLAGCIRCDQIVAEGVDPIVFAVWREAVRKERADRLRRRDTRHLIAPSGSVCDHAIRCRSGSTKPTPGPCSRGQSSKPYARVPSRPKPNCRWDRTETADRRENT